MLQLLATGEACLQPSPVLLMQQTVEQHLHHLPEHEQHLPVAPFHVDRALLLRAWQHLPRPSLWLAGTMKRGYVIWPVCVVAMSTNIVVVESPATISASALTVAKM